MKQFVLAIAAAASIASPSILRAQRADSLRLSLSEAIELALRVSDEMRVSDAQGDVADAQVGTARATALPQLRVNSNFQHVWENARANAVGQLFNQPNTYNASLVLTQTLFQGG